MTLVPFLRNWVRPRTMPLLHIAKGEDASDGELS